MGALGRSRVGRGLKFSRLALPCSKVNPRHCHSSSGSAGQGLQPGRGPEGLQVGSDCKENSGTFEECAWKITAPGEGQRGWRGAESGHQVFCTWCRHALPAGWAGAELARIPGSGFRRWRDRCLRKLERSLRKQTDRTPAFLSPCPDRSLISFPSCKIPPLAFPTAKPPHAGAQNLPRHRERALCSRPGLPGTLLSPGIGRAPRRRVVFSHAVLQWAFFHSTIDGPTAFISRN